MKFLFLALFIISGLSLHASEVEVLREPSTGFPLCVENRLNGTSVFFKWRNSSFSRIILSSLQTYKCRDYKYVSSRTDIEWYEHKETDYTFIPEDITKELRQVAQKANVLRKDFSAEEYLKNHPLEEYTVEVNRDLTKKYGQLFSAQVFKAHVESKDENQAFLQNVLKELSQKKISQAAPFSLLKGRVKLVVSFGLGWDEKYGKTIPYYIEDFLHDMKWLGLDVHFIKKNPFGTVHDNVEKIVPELKSSLMSGQDVILVSLCKGTPELLAAEAELAKLPLEEKEKFGKILGHINLSGMLSGAIFSDFAEEVMLPKYVAPLMKMIPFAAIRDNAKMVDAIEYMKTSIIEETLKTATPHLNKDLLYINVTGAPMSNAIIESKSPMKMIVKYNIRNAFIDSANDGFLELPSTLIPASVSTNQLTLVLDSTHMLSDGNLNGHKLSEKKVRRTIYYSVLKEVLKRDPQYSAGL